MPAALYSGLLRQAQDLHAAGMKAYGLLLGDPADPRFPYSATDVVIFDPRRNRRNDPAFQPAFHAQGSYFRRYDDAGFVADPTDLFEAWRAAEDAGLEPVAPFHVHRRQPCNFSSIDFRLHNPAFRWHLIISLRDPRQPAIQPFAVTKGWDDFGIDETDALESSELAYRGPEVRPLQLALSADPGTIERVA
ncbi:Mov34/MPN/PAD-1 family protein [Microlunatus ginsengisoli]